MKKNNAEKKDLINLNSKIYDVLKVEELEQRLELTSWFCDNCDLTLGCPCITACPPAYPAPLEEIS